MRDRNIKKTVEKFCSNFVLVFYRKNMLRQWCTANVSISTKYLSTLQCSNPVSLNIISGVMIASHLPVLVGSGVTIDNVQNYLGAAAFIVGSHFKLNSQ